MRGKLRISWRLLWAVFLMLGLPLGIYYEYTRRDELSFLQSWSELQILAQVFCWMLAGLALLSQQGCGLTLLATLAGLLALFLGRMAGTVLSSPPVAGPTWALLLSCICLFGQESALEIRRLKMPVLLLITLEGVLNRAWPLLLLLPPAHFLFEGVVRFNLTRPQPEGEGPRGSVAFAVLLGLLPLLAWLGLPKDPPYPTPTRQTFSKPEWNVLVMALGVEGLQPAIERDLSELTRMGSGHGVEIVGLVVPETNCRVAGCSFSKEKATLVHLLAGKIEKLEEWPLDSSGEALQRLLKAGLRLYPARRTALILNGHGAGAFGFSGISSQRLGEILSENGFDSQRPLDLLATDACLMGNLEFATALSQRCNLLIASESVEPARGYHYDYAMAALQHNPLQTPQDLARNLDDIYAQFMAGRVRESGLSILDLRKLPALRESLRSLAQQANSNLTSRQRADLLQIEVLPESRSLVDLNGLLERFQNEPGLQTSVQNCQLALHTLLLAHGNGGGYSGLSCLLPCNRNDLDLLDPGPWASCLQPHLLATAELQLDWDKDSVVALPVEGTLALRDYKAWKEMRLFYARQGEIFSQETELPPHGTHLALKADGDLFCWSDGKAQFDLFLEEVQEVVVDKVFSVDFLAGAEPGRPPATARATYQAETGKLIKLEWAKTKTPCKGVTFVRRTTDLKHWKYSQFIPKAHFLGGIIQTRELGPGKYQLGVLLTTTDGHERLVEGLVQVGQPKSD